MATMSDNYRRRRAGSEHESVYNKIDYALHQAAGEAVGGAIEKAILGGREATGTHKFSETYQGRRRRKMAGIKGLAANRQY